MFERYCLIRRKKLLKWLGVLLLCLHTQLNASQLPQVNGIHELPKSAQHTIHQWITFAIDATQAQLGPLEANSYAFDIEAKWLANEPVPWAQINRAKPNRVALTIDRFAELEELKQDWTLYHELAHLYLPLTEADSIWLNEGFATYMQQHIMLRQGLLNQVQYTQRVRAGLARGKIQTRKVSGALNEVSDNMWHLNAYQRVYWSGVAYFIEAEIALLDRNTNLKDVILACRACTQDSSTLTGSELVTLLDRYSQSQVFSRLYFQYRTRADFPAISDAQITRTYQQW